jgi:hypothetical protein
MQAAKPPLNSSRSYSSNLINNSKRMEEKGEGNGIKLKLSSIICSVIGSP